MLFELHIYDSSFVVVFCWLEFIQRIEGKDIFWADVAEEIIQRPEFTV